MKALKIIKKILLSLIVIVYFSFALFMTILVLNFNDYNVTQFDDTSLVIISEEVSHDDYKKGDLVIVKSEKVEKLQKGDLIFTYKLDSNNVPHIEIGTIGDVYPDQDAITFENGISYTSEFIIGKPLNTYNNIGGFLKVVESRWGFLFIVLVPCFLIFIYELYALIVEIKYGAEEQL